KPCVGRRGDDRASAPRDSELVAADTPAWTPHDPRSISDAGVDDRGAILAGGPLVEREDVLEVFGGQWFDDRSCPVDDVTDDGVIVRCDPEPEPFDETAAFWRDRADDR